MTGDEVFFVKHQWDISEKCAIQTKYYLSLELIVVIICLYDAAWVS